MEFTQAMKEELLRTLQSIIMEHKLTPYQKEALSCAITNTNENIERKLKKSA